MALLTTQVPLVTGATVTYAAAAGGGDTFVNTGKESILAINASVSSITVTITVQTACNFGSTHASHSYAVVVGAGSNKRIGPFALDRFNDADRLVHVTYSGVTTLTVAVLG